MLDDKIITLLLDCLHQDIGRVSTGRLTTLTLAEWQGLLALPASNR